MQAIKEGGGFVTPLEEGEAMVTPPGFLLLQVVTQEAWGMKWGVHFKGTEPAVAKLLGELVLAHPALAAQGYESFRSFLAAELEAKAC